MLKSPFHHISSTGLPLVNPLPYCLMAVLRYFVLCILRHPHDSNLMAESCSASEDSSPFCWHGNHTGKQGLAYLQGANECMFVFPKMEINMSWRVPDLPLWKTQQNPSRIRGTRWQRHQGQKAAYASDNEHEIHIMARLNGKESPETKRLLGCFFVIAGSICLNHRPRHGWTSDFSFVDDGWW